MSKYDSSNDGKRILIDFLQEQLEAAEAKKESLNREITQGYRDLAALQEQQLAQAESEKRFLAAAALIPQEHFGLVKDQPDNKVDGAAPAPESDSTDTRS